MNLFISILLLIASSCLADNSDRSDRSKIADNSVSDKQTKEIKVISHLLLYILKNSNKEEQIEMYLFNGHIRS